MTFKELLLLVERDIRKCADKKGNVKITDIEREITHAISQVDSMAKEDIPIKKFIFVEDGSVDTDELEESLYRRNPEIKMIVHRQGSMPPMLINAKEDA